MRRDSVTPASSNLDNSATSGGSLSEAQRAHYWEAGYLFPLTVLSEDEVAHYHGQLTDIEREHPPGLPQPLGSYLRIQSHCVLPMAAQLATHPTVLNAVESILGPDLMIWGAEFFIKEAKSDSVVSMHQDLTYWGFGETSDQVTAWIALTPSTVESGCMDLVYGSHKNPILPHTDTHADNNLLSRGQEINVDVSDSDRTHVILQPGQMSLHHGLAIHGSQPNRSEQRRIGFAIRYVNPSAKQTSVRREYAMLARGVDRSDAFIHFCAPTEPFSAASLSLHAEIVDAQSRVLGAGMAADQQLYGGSPGRA